LQSEYPQDALKEFKELSINQLNQLAEIVRGDLTELQRGVLGALITIDVHARDIVEELISEGVNSDTDFGWTKQLRYYWNTDIGKHYIQVNSKSGHRRLHGDAKQFQLHIWIRISRVHSKISIDTSDRCYMTLTSALHLDMGGAPSGPAGTGKTETVKDLAKALAKQCVVFNCSEVFKL
jgi:dynein heavy chain